ncbi:hypothetical protein L6164_019603 [Bauhinia variegata]|uniref:Uncharacterized protein n=1 Tax=Bauhinia variegata TaxID=167791 RepID=A0ACB9MS99_BAUVA|nr:hypothetical protein L6164_019603 [Bauhinia variegata]
MSTLPETHGKTVADAWDYKGRPAEKAKTGGWTSAAMILCAEATERLTTLGIAFNLVTYLTGTMHFGNASAANTVTNFLGTSFMLCLLGGFVADTFLGRYLTIAIFATVQALGVTILTISTIIPSLHPSKCTAGSGKPCEPASGMQLLVLYLALYVTALGTGGLKSSVSGFGSDQFDDSEETEKKRMLKFFNWFFFFISIGSLAAVTILFYIQDNIGREWGYGICAFAIVVALLIFLLGTRRYRFRKLVGSPLTQIAVVFVAAWRKRHLESPSDPSWLFDVDGIPDQRQNKKKQKQRLPHSRQFRFLDKAAIKESETGSGTMEKKWYLSTLTDVEEVKMEKRLAEVGIELEEQDAVFHA